MSGWRDTAIRDVARHVTVGFVGAQAPHFTDCGVPLLRGQNIRPYSLDLSNLKYISTETHARWNKSRLTAGDVAIVRVGYPGTAAVIPEGMGELNAASLVIVRPDPDLLDPYFLAYVLNSPWGRSEVSARFVGAAQQVLNTGAVSGLRIPLPPLAIQHAVSGALRLFDNLIDINLRRVKVLGEIARAVYREWFVKFRYPGHEVVPLVDSALGPIPYGWSIDPFDAIASFVNGFAFKPAQWGSDGRPIIKIKELKAGIASGTPRCPEGTVEKKYWVEGGDLLMSWSADLGVYLWADEPGLLNQHLFAVRPSNDTVSLFYLLHALDHAMPEFRARAQGTTMKHIKRAALHEVSTLIAPPTLLARFDEAVGPIHEESMTLQAQTRNLSAMRDLLLPKLVTGQIDVSSLDLDALVGGRVA